MSDDSDRIDSFGELVNFDFLSELDLQQEDEIEKSLSLTVDLLQAFALVGSFQCLFEKPIELCELNLHQEM